MTRTDLQQALSRHFNLDELRDLCFALKIEHENFGDKKDPFIRELVLFCERTDITQALITECHQQRPNFATGGLGAIFAGVPPPLEKKIIGREALVDELAGQLVREQARALSAEGMGGVGKTTLALVLAHDPRIRAHFVDGVLWAGLGQTADAMAALASWAEALGGDVSQMLEPADRAREVQRRIGARKMLLVIDDVWSLETAQHLKCGGPNCCHLLTTRDSYIAKQFAQGQVSAVPPLDNDNAFALLRTLAPEACAADPTAARELAQRAGGLPLALEVLGGYLAIPEHTEFPELREQAFATLREPRTRLQLATQRLGAKNELSLQAVLELSLRDFPTAAQQAWLALGAFAHKPATFSLAAAKAVCACNAATLATFVRRNLLEKVDDTTLALHQTLAEVAQTASSTEREGAAARHRQFYLDLANKDRNDWRTIEAAYAQIQFAWENAPMDESFLQLIGAARLYQNLRGLWRDQIDCIERGFEICKQTENRKDEASLLNNIGMVYHGLGQRDKALAYLERALPITEEVGNRPMLATTLNSIGTVYDSLGQRDKALAYFERALPITEEVGNRPMLATTLNNTGMVYHGLGQRDKALAYLERALPIMEEVGDRKGLAVTLNNIGAVYDGLGQRDKALAYYERALPITEEVGNRPMLATMLSNIGTVYDGLGQRDKALAYFERALPIHEEVGNRPMLATTLNNIGMVYDGLGQRDKALVYLERALSIHEEVGNRPGLAVTLNNIGGVYNGLEQRDKALAYLERALPILEEVGDLNGESITRTWLGILLEQEGRLPEAEAHLIRSVQICEEIRSPNLEMIRGWLEEVRDAMDNPPQL